MSDGNAGCGKPGILMSQKNQALTICRDKCRGNGADLMPDESTDPILRQ